MASGTKALSRSSAIDPVVVLVDDRIRDLNVAALIAHHLENLGVRCHLEPLEAFRAALGAYRPGMIVFNHLNAGHLAAWSKRLADIGVLTAVLPNEGLVYREEQREFLSGRFHEAHTDYFFCWNEMHAESVERQSASKAAHIEVVGVPRFDFYFEPWSKIVPSARGRRSQRPQVLFCTNFSLTSFAEHPDAADKLFGNWASKSSLYADYKGAIESQLRRRVQVLGILENLIDDGRFEILLRPHPREDRGFYMRWLDGLSADRRASFQFDPDSSITSLILGCDLQISCESCTTTLESWIARKPTISIVFDRHPMLYREIQAEANYECDDPRLLPDLIAQHILQPEQQEKRALRDRHLKAWCATPQGNSAYRIASTIADAVRTKHAADWSKLTANDYRRTLKLMATHRLGEAYHYDPFLGVKSLFLGARYMAKRRGYDKSIKPADVAEARNLFEGVALEAGNPAARAEASADTDRMIVKKLARQTR